MSLPAISVEGVSKEYRIGAAGERMLSRTFREAILDAAAAPLRRLRRPGDAHSGQQSFWALKDVSFAVPQGEVVGLIGRNGAGKSTMLKVLSRIAEPTTGRVVLRGRVASLLEVGTGFHQELTGRENVYLNASILGMTRREIQARFDEIIAFAEVEQFIDTPVKRYSSGMYLRLAFAVAAFLEPEILLVDEVLAVGDASFQKKCLGKMGEVARDGRTVVLVSHNMAAIQRLCNTTILMNSGRLVSHGPTAEVTALYLQQGIATSLCWERSTPPESDAYFQKVYLADETGRPMSYVTTADTLHVAMEFELRTNLRDLQLGVGLSDEHGTWIFGSAPQDSGQAPPAAPGRYRAVARFPRELLLPKAYGIRTTLWVPGIGPLDCRDDLQFTVQEAASLYNSVASGRAGLIALPCDWSVERTDESPLECGGCPLGPTPLWNAGGAGCRAGRRSLGPGPGSGCGGARHRSTAEAGVGMGCGQPEP